MRSDGLVSFTPSSLAATRCFRSSRSTPRVNAGRRWIPWPEGRAGAARGTWLSTPAGRLAYLLNELDATPDVLATIYQQLSALQTVPFLPPGFSGEPWRRQASHPTSANSIIERAPPGASAGRLRQWMGLPAAPSYRPRRRNRAVSRSRAVRLPPDRAGQLSHAVGVPDRFRRAARTDVAPRTCCRLQSQLSRRSPRSGPHLRSPVCPVSPHLVAAPACAVLPTLTFAQEWPGSWADPHHRALCCRRHQRLSWP